MIAMATATAGSTIRGEISHEHHRVASAHTSSKPSYAAKHLEIFES